MIQARNKKADERSNVKEQKKGSDDSRNVASGYTLCSLFQLPSVICIPCLPCNSSNPALFSVLYPNIRKQLGHKIRMRKAGISAYRAVVNTPYHLLIYSP
jgi:hypothetical protein